MNLRDNTTIFLRTDALKVFYENTIWNKMFMLIICLVLSSWLTYFLNMYSIQIPKPSINLWTHSSSSNCLPSLEAQLNMPTLNWFLDDTYLDLFTSLTFPETFYLIIVYYYSYGTNMHPHCIYFLTTYPTLLCIRL